MFQLKDDAAFKQHLRDFLVQTKSFADKNNADLYAEEAAQQREVSAMLADLPWPCNALLGPADGFCRLPAGTYTRL